MKNSRKSAPRCIIIAGPNGAGKTSPQEFLPRYANVVHFVNADLIAGGLSPLNPESAAIAAGRPQKDAARRFHRSWENFRNIYQDIADAWMIYDNSGKKAILIEEGP